MSAPRNSSARKSPPELLLATHSTPSPSAVRLGSSNPEVLDLTEDANGAATLGVSGTRLTCIWNEDYIEFCIVQGNKGWKCKWCGKLVKTRHSTRALWHLLKIAGN